MAYNQSTSQVDNNSVTITLNDDDARFQSDVGATVRLKLRKPKSSKKVNWMEGTIDNENMDKKKSKCCCIYKKPQVENDSSSSEDENECEHCQGHVEKNKRSQKGNPPTKSTESHQQSMIAA